MRIELDPFDTYRIEWIVSAYFVLSWIVSSFLYIRYDPQRTPYLHLTSPTSYYRATGQLVIYVRAYMYAGPASTWIVSSIEVHLTGSYRVSNGCPAVHRTDRIELILSSIQIPSFNTLCACVF